MLGVMGMSGGASPMGGMNGGMNMSMGLQEPMPQNNNNVDTSMSQLSMGFNQQQQLFMQMLQFFQQSQQVGEGFGGMSGMPTSMFPLQGLSASQPLPQADAQIEVAVEGMQFQYQLTQDDLEKVFSRYGNVKHIKVGEAGSRAQITFSSAMEAANAMQDLNGKVLNGLDGTLRVNWVVPPPETFNANSFMCPENQDYGFQLNNNMPWAQNGADHLVHSDDRNADEARFSTPEKQQQSELVTSGKKGVRKYTCRFMIGIENDKEFQVARRIIGAKGANMKRVVKQTDAKLRLRGVGSGYIEGAGQKESSEPLQLCISCTNLEGYKLAVSQVEELLSITYEEYRTFCRDNARPVPDLRINMSENQLVYSGKNASSPPAIANGGSPGLIGASLSGIESPQKDSQRNRRSRGGKIAGGLGTLDLDRIEPGPHAPPVDEIERLVDERNEARRASNFAEADRIRALLHSKGVALMDEPGGRGKGSDVTVWRYWRE